jgi:hypothetical protein
MKKIFAVVGLVLAGVSSLTAQYAPGRSAIETSKFWTVSGSLRGFYDDNYTTGGKTPTVNFARSSFGFEVSPSAAINLYPGDATAVSASYVYVMRWYEARKHNTADHTHQFNVKLDQAFSDHLKMTVDDSFVIAQEPTIIDTTLTTSPLRTDGNNVRNRGSIDFMADLSENAGLELSYANSYYDYEQDMDRIIKFGGTLPSRSALLDRMEHLAGLDFRWRFTPQTVGILGYQYGQVNFNSDEPILFALTPTGIVGIKAKIRDARMHNIMVGADHTFNTQLTGSVRVGGQYYDYYKLSDTQFNPYIDMRLTYTYLAGSYAQVGVKHMHNATDVAGNVAGDPVRDQESTSFYASVTHKITGNLTGSLLGQFQHSVFNGGGSSATGGIDGKADDFYIFGLNLAYHFNPHLLVEAGYNYDRLDSDLGGGRSYTRNRGYIGIRATY